MAVQNASTVIFTTGVPGAGKSYVRCACFLVDDFLPHGDGVHYSNFPVNCVEVAKAVSRKMNIKRGLLARIFGRKSEKITFDQIFNRVQIIPKEVMKTWRDGTSGPWEYFADKKLTGGHIAIDEIHEYCNIRLESELKKKWGEWIGTIRHQGCTVEFITQDPTHVLTEIKGRAGLQLLLEPSESERDPFFHIIMADWYELQACFTGEYKKGVFEHEMRKVPNKSGRTDWQTNRVRKFRIQSDYFKFYNSYNQSIINDEHGSEEVERPKHEYEKRSKLSLVCWFFFRNFFQIVPRIVGMIIIFWLLLGGGINYGIKKFIGVLGSVSSANGGMTNGKQVNKKQIMGKDRKSVQVGTEAIGVHSEVSDQQELTELDKKKIEINSLNLKIIDLEKQIIKLKRFEELAFSPVMFVNNSAHLKNGLVVTRGYIISGGIYDGIKVTEVSFKGRFIKLSNNKLLRMSD